MKTIRLISALFGASLLLLSCGPDPALEPDDVPPPYVTTDSATVKVTCAGESYVGGPVIVAVKSDTYWVASFDEENTPWLSMPVKAAYGDKEIILKVAENEGEARQTVIRFEIENGEAHQLTVIQGPVDEVIPGQDPTKDNRKVGYVYYDEPFAWTALFGDKVEDHVSNPNLEGLTVRFDLVPTGDYPAEAKEAFAASGWTQPSTATPVYIGLGYLKFAKSKTAGVALSPVLGLKKGTIMNCTLSLNASGYGSDYPNFVIEVLGGGTINSSDHTCLEVETSTFHQWPEKPFTFNLYNITDATQMLFRSAHTTEYLAEANMSNRFFIDNILVSKADQKLPVEEGRDWANPLPAPVVKGIKVGDRSVTIDIEPVEHALNGYEYTVTSGGQTFASGVTSSTSIVINNLVKDVTYSATVRALTYPHSLRYADSAPSVAVEFTGKELGPKEDGFTLFSDNFDWTETVYNEGGCTAETMYNDAKVKAGFDAAGYKAKGRVYMRAGCFKIGRAARTDGAAYCGSLIFPENWAGSHLAEGDVISVKFSADIAVSNTSDFNTYYILATTDGSTQEKTVEATSTTAKNFEVIFENVKPSTVFTIESRETGKASRPIIDNVLIKTYVAQ